jgi:hypothetical protein
MSGPRHLTLWGLFVLAAVGAASARGESEALRLPETLSASPNSPAFGYIWRRGSRIVLGLAIPVLGGSSNAQWGLHLTPFVELHNAPGSLSLVSNEEWRGRASFELWRSWVKGSDPEAASWLRLGVGFDHESDHASVRREVPVPPFGFRQLNDISFRATVSATPSPRWIASAELTSLLFLASCTQPRVDCLQHWDTSYGGSLNLVLQHRLGTAQTWRGFASLSLSWTVPAGRVIRESRIVSHVGLWHRGSIGAWQIFVLGFIGNDVGIGREKVVYEWGAGLRWNP